jgi:hypothetical protein
MKSISVVSTMQYPGNTGSGSVSGYYTIWTARINANGYITGQPKPRKINQNILDLSKFRGKLYMVVGGHNLVRVKAKECNECKKLSLITEGLERCKQCYDKDIFGLL